MRPVMALLMFYSLSRRASARVCNSSSFVAPTVVVDTNTAAQLAEAVNCDGGYFAVEWIGQVALDGEINIGENTTLEVFGAANGSSYVNGSHKNRLFQNDGGSLHLYNLTLTNRARDVGGAIAVQHGGQVMIINCTFTANNATRGGAIYTNNATVRLLESAYFDGNFGVHSGGAIYGEASAVIFFEGRSGFRGNKANRNGGGIHVWDNSSVEIYGTVMFEENTAFQGGALMIGESSNLNVFGTTTFDSNIATASGGGIYAQNARYMDFSANSKVSMLNNTAKNGGAVGALKSPVFIAGDVIMESNTATTFGGAMYCDGSAAEAVIKTCMFVGNNATRGGAIFNRNATVRLQGHTDFDTTWQYTPAGLFSVRRAHWFSSKATQFSMGTKRMKMEEASMCGITLLSRYMVL